MIVFLIPVTALLLALVWTYWARRPDKPLDPLSQVEAYRKSVNALAGHRQRHRIGRRPRSSD